ncbi:MAG: tetratricopeptide repeat protein, partial [Chloroflexi bacterium]|nr:tetratricopeptide repeat protein [Chloroflexota bacterium]
RLAEMPAGEEKASLELSAAHWVYDFIRANIKRGRLFSLDAILAQGSADCLGYAQLYTLLGRRLGLDIGVIEVIIDNAGRNIPHTANLLKLSNQERRLLDLWYGSKDINHRRIGLRAKEGKEWVTKDVDWEKQRDLKDVASLSDEEVQGMVRYVWGNRYLQAEKWDRAIECYTQAIGLYPTNPRFYFNRAVACESKGEGEKAERDYAYALKDDNNLLRVLALEQEEVNQLMRLDATRLDCREQEVYLLAKGFITGKEVPSKELADRCGLSETEVKVLLADLEARLRRE